MTWSALLGYLSGVWLLAPGLREEHLVPTVLVIHVLDAILSRVFARNNGYRENLWTVIGFIGGLWAVLYLLAHTRRLHRRGLAHLAADQTEQPRASTSSNTPGSA